MTIMSLLTMFVVGLSSIPNALKTIDYRLSLDLQEVVDQVLPNRNFHMAAHDWGSLQSWESVTEPKLKPFTILYNNLRPLLDMLLYICVKSLNLHQVMY